MEVSPDGKHYAVLVRQADAEANDFRTGWFVGQTAKDALTYVGQGGCARPSLTAAGFSGGEIESRPVRWSPDGKWIAYTLNENGEIQLWRSSADGKVQEQLSHNAGDVYEFEWSSDSRSIYFTAGVPRSQRRLVEERKFRDGYNYNEDVYSFSNFMQAELTRPPETTFSFWTVDLSVRIERIGSSLERESFDLLQSRHSHPGSEGREYVTTNSRGGIAWATQLTNGGFQVMASLPKGKLKHVECKAEQCRGAIRGIGWSDNHQEVVFWRGEGIDNTIHAFYAWAPMDDRVRSLLRAPDDELRLCQFTRHDTAICVRETKQQPSHVAAVYFAKGTVQVIGDLNPEFQSIQLGKVKRIEWETPELSWNTADGPLPGLYPKRAYGYIVLPPGFDASKKYPAIVEPYIAHGFEPSVGGEHPLHVYAANGFVVLNLAFPWPDPEAVERLGLTNKLMRTLYSADLDFPHLTMLTHSTVAGLDAALARGFIDARRVGMGGVSHGTFVPLHLAWKVGRVSALSISSPVWGPHEYYWGTRKQREMELSDGGVADDLGWRLKPEGAGREFWSQIDPADHVNEIRAPILMQLADQEAYALLRLIRHLDDAGRPYDAYIFRNENHIKWQPAHLKSIQARNLDWFRFWLQGYEDPAPEKEAQYKHWRNLKLSSRSSIDRVNHTAAWSN